MQFLKPFALAVTLLTLIPAVLTGCRFGNQTTITTEGYDTVSGYYATEPVSFDVDLKFTDAPSRAVELPVAQMPAYYSRSLTNPVILVLQSVQTGKAYLVSKDNSNYYQPTVVDQISLTIGLSETQSLNHYGCRVDLTISDVGGFNKNNPSVVNGLNVRGRLKIAREFEVRYTGVEANCQELRDIFHLCLTDEAGCPNESHLVNADILYQSFLSTGALTAAEIKTATYLRHTAKHQ